ncbi:MAG: hypothetical protein Q9165_005562 [Trypethelium subeluteriae]
MPAVTRSQFHPQDLQLLSLAASNDLDLYRLRQWIQSEEIKGALLQWWYFGPTKETYNESRTQDYYRVVSQKAKLAIDSHYDGSNSVASGERSRAFNPQDDVEVFSQTIEHLVLDANGKWIFVEKRSLLRGSLVVKYCESEQLTIPESGDGEENSSEDSDFEDSADGDLEDGADGEFEDDADGDFEDGTDDTEDSLQDFVVADDECERDIDASSISEMRTENKIGPSPHSRGLGEKAQEVDEVFVNDKSIFRPPVRPVVTKDYGIFASSWAQRAARKGLCENQGQHKRKLPTEAKNHQRRRKTITKIISDDERDDEEDFADVKLISVARRGDSSNDKECKSNPGPTVAAQEGEAAALLQLQSIKTRMDGVEEAMRTAEVMKTDLQKELQEAVAARKTAEEAAAEANKEMAAVKGKQDNIGKALREAGFAFIG